MDKVIEQIDALTTHVFNMPKSADTDMLLAGLQDLRNMVAAQQSVQADGAYCTCNPNEAPYEVGKNICAVCKKPRR